MTKQSEIESQACCATELVSKGGKCCYQIAGLVVIDERGQLILPTDVREKARVKAVRNLSPPVREPMARRVASSWAKLTISMSPSKGCLGQ